MRLLHFEVSPGLRNESIVTLAYLWQGLWEASGIRGLRNHTTNIWPLPHDQLPGKISAFHCKIINSLQLLILGLCLLFWANGADHLTFDGEGGMMGVLIMQDHFAAKPTSVMGFFFSYFDVNIRPLTQGNLYLCSKSFCRILIFPSFFLKSRNPPPHPLESRMAWP